MEQRPWPPCSRCEASGPSISGPRLTTAPESVSSPSLTTPFYSGARSVLMVLDHMAEGGDSGEGSHTIQRFGKQIGAILARQPRRSH